MGTDVVGKRVKMRLVVSGIEVTGGAFRISCGCFGKLYCFFGSL